MKTKTKTQEHEYPAIVHEIHREFLTEGERLLSEAKEHLTGIAVKEKKISLLDAIGFENVKEVAQKGELLIEKRQHNKMAHIIHNYACKYPNYKFITEDSVDVICKKYALVWGGIEFFTGFVPMKNAQDIKTFFRNLREEDVETTGTNGWFGTKKKKSLKELLFIVAPQKDFDADRAELKGNKMEKKSPPDPIVLFQVPNGFLICTAWGDEATDPLVINERNN